jgi:hypothetical protein
VCNFTNILCFVASDYTSAATGRETSVNYTSPIPSIDNFTGNSNTNSASYSSNSNSRTFNYNNNNNNNNNVNNNNNNGNSYMSNSSGYGAALDNAFGEASAPAATQQINSNASMMSAVNSNASSLNFNNATSSSSPSLSSSFNFNNNNNVDAGAPLAPPVETNSASAFLVADVESAARGSDPRALGTHTPLSHTYHIDTTLLPPNQHASIGRQSAGSIRATARRAVVAAAWCVRGAGSAGAHRLRRDADRCRRCSRVGRRRAQCRSAQRCRLALKTNPHIKT